MDSEEIRKILDIYKLRKIPVLLYEDIVTLHPCIFLYDGPKMGHWCCIVKHPKRWEFFDPEGVCIDKEFDFDNITKRENKLKELYLLNSKGIEYNAHKFQHRGNTCGLWCIWRLLNRHLSCAQFVKAYRNATDYDVANFFNRLDLLK